MREHGAAFLFWEIGKVLKIEFGSVLLEFNLLKIMLTPSKIGASIVAFNGL